MRKGSLGAFLIFSLIGLVLALCVHIATFFGINPQQTVPYVWVLHVGIFLGVLPLLIINNKTSGGRFGRIDIKQISKFVPRWLNILCVVIGIYAALNFGLAIALSEGGVPDIRDGVYVLQNKGAFIRVLTEAEYNLHQAYEVRLFSGHWVLFYLLLSTGYYGYLIRKDKPTN